jgi:hypothetical protein
MAGVLTVVNGHWGCMACRSALNDVEVRLTPTATGLLRLWPEGTGCIEARAAARELTLTFEVVAWVSSQAVKTAAACVLQCATATTNYQLSLLDGYRQMEESLCIHRNMSLNMHMHPMNCSSGLSGQSAHIHVMLS